MTSSPSTPLRKLAAIMFTDIAGYTKAMSADEETALATLRRKRAILKPLIIDCNGTFVKEIGDGTLSYFPSAIDAATCAVKLQQATYDDTDMNLRVGVHIGDIVFDDEDVFGDGVNVAARLESMAPVGGVCVSKSVFEELLNKKEFDGVPLGLQQLKGVGRLIDVFALKAKNLIHPDPKEYEEHKVEPHSDDEVPSVAILPLKNKGKEEDAFYAYGITADLISDLSRAGKIRVVSMDDIATANVTNLSSKEAAKKLHVRYIVNGMLWKHEDMFQLSIEMDDTKHNSVVWSDRWQERWDELTNIKSKFTESLLQALNIGAAKGGVTKDIQTNTEAYEYYLKGKYRYENRMNEEDEVIAQGFFKQALEIDPHFIMAKVQLANTYYRQFSFDKAFSLLEKALAESERVGNDNLTGRILNIIGVAYSWKKDREKSAEYYKNALSYSEKVNDINGAREILINLGISSSKIGMYDVAQSYFQRSLDVCKVLEDDRELLRAYRNMGKNYQEQGEYQQALTYFKLAFSASKNMVPENRFDQAEIGWSHFTLGGVYRDMGDYVESLIEYEKAKEGLQVLEDTTLSLFIDCQVAWCSLQSGDMNTANVILSEIEMTLTHNSVVELWEGVIAGFYWNLYRVCLKLDQMENSMLYIQMAHDDVMLRAGTYIKKNHQESFLNKVRTNREIIAAWESTEK